MGRLPRLALDAGDRAPALHVRLACVLLSSVLASVLLPVPRDAVAGIYSLPEAGNSVVGETARIEASSKETLLDVARRYGLGYEDIVRANSDVDPWLPEHGADVVLATQFILPDSARRGLVLNLAEFRLYFYPAPVAGGDPVVMTFPMSIGRMDWETPLGLTRITQKTKNPSWYPPQSVRQEHAADGDPLPAVVPPGPQNPLGSYALRLSLPGYLIHGTNKAAGVGMRVTHGCLRLFPEDIETLFGQVAVGTEVRIVNQPVKAGWLGEELLLEVHPMLESAAANEDSGPGADGESDSGPEIGSESLATTGNSLTNLTRAIVAATKIRRADVDWTLAEEVYNRAQGVPVVIGRLIADDDALVTKKNAATGAAFKM